MKLQNNIYKINKLILLFIIPTFFYAQIPSIQWQKTYGIASHNQANDIKPTLDGGYIIAGYALGPYQHSQYYIVKINSNGVMMWEKNLGGTWQDEASSVDQTADGGYIVAGFTLSNDGDVSINYGETDYWIIRLDSNGNIIWKKSFGGSKSDNASSVKQTSDGGFIISGSSYSNDGNVTENHSYPQKSDYWIVKLDNLGNLLWQKTYGGLSSETSMDIKETSDNGYIIAGNSDSNDNYVIGNHGKTDYWIIKLNSTGNLQWQKSFGGSQDDFVKSIEQTSDNGYIVVGTTQSNDGNVTGLHGEKDIWILKLKGNGDIQWQKTFGGSKYEYGQSVDQTLDGGYIVAGTTTSNDGDVTGLHGTVGINSDYWILKLDNNGNLQSQKTFGGLGTDIPNKIKRTNDNGYIIAGFSDSHDGDVTPNPTVLYESYWIVKLAPELLKVKNTENETFKVYPNPTTDYININTIDNINSLKIIDLTGKLLIEKIGNFERINVKSLKTGVYFLEIKTDEKIKIIKIIKN